MGQKINPKSLRLGVTKNWPVRWFFATAPETKGKTSFGKTSVYAKFLEEDEAIRKVIKEKIAQAGIAGVEIERTASDLRIFVRAARPGFIIGRGGKGIEDLNIAIKKALHKISGPRPAVHVSLNVEELKRSETSSTYIAQQIAWDLEKRMPYRRTMKKYIDQTMQSRDVKGMKVLLSGRLGGSEIARRETLKQGALPLQTLRAEIDYGRGTAFTTYGTIGIKVWVYKGEIFETKKTDDTRTPARK